MENKRRLDYLDLAKGIGILLVTIGHVYGYDANIFENWMFSFHMPLFFIVSGCLIKLKNENISKNTIIKRFKSLMIPYICFSAIFLIENMFLYNFNIPIIKSYIIQVVFLGGIQALWFLPCLFVAEILFLLLNQIKIKGLKITSLILCFIISYYISTVNYNYTMKFSSRVLIATGFIWIGYQLFEFINNKEIPMLNIAIILIINIILFKINGRVDIYNIVFNNLIIFILNATITSYGLIMMSKKINCNFIKYCGINSLIIMCTHQPLLNIINKFTGKTEYGYLIGFILFVFIMLIEIPIIEIINNYLPFMLGKFKKKEKVQTITD